MILQNRPVYVLGGSRTPFTKSMTKYMGITTEELMLASMRDLVSKFKLQGKVMGDIALGGVINNPANWSIARECALKSGLSPLSPAHFIQRACGTSLDSTNDIALKIGAGQIEYGISGGFDTNSDLPILFPRSFSNKLLKLKESKTTGQKLSNVFSFGLADLKPQIPGVYEPQTGLSMGEHCEKMVQEWKIPREDQDELAYLSHIHAAEAYKKGFFSDLVFEYKGLKADTLLRADTTREKLAKLKPAFDKEKGTLTAGNSSPLTDGSSAALLASEKGAKDLGLEPLAKIVDVQVAAVNYVAGEGLLMAPTIAVAQLLQRNNLKLQDFDYYEIHEAFAGQVLCTLKAWQSDEYCQKHMGTAALGSIDRTKLNINGSSLALGHPFGATGTRIVASLAKMLYKTSGKRGLISICTAGGMGVTAILESV